MINYFCNRYIQTLKKYKITPKIKKGDDKAQFLFNHKVGYKNSQIYKNVDDAKGAPLIQQLFFLPFVKSVTLKEKKLIVERFNILEWEEVADEVCEQLENYLNNGGSIIEKIPTTVYAESTPNPSVMKFVANKLLVPESFEFKNIDEAKISPLAQKLFHFPFIKEIFINSNYISITKYEINSWDEVVMEIREFVRSFLEEGNIVIEESIE
ncbi:MAG: NifU N-terminal domain-containing protein, partial [Bacteroidota bacterium]|nr:NifU N-terminal domain-containing protein [Bacteroidota bacterium]